MKARVVLNWVVAIAVATGIATAEDKKDNTKSTGDDRTDREMVKLQKKARGIETVTAELATTIRVEDQEVTLAGPGQFKGPGKMRVEKSLPDGSSQVVLNDGSYLWIHDRGENMVSRINLSRVYQITQAEADVDQFDPLRPFRGVEWTSIRHAGTDTIAGVVHEAFEAMLLPSLLSAQLPSPPTKVRLSIHPADGLLRMARLYNEAGDEVIVQTFLDVQANREIADRTFEFIVPAGAHPMDATDETIRFFQSVR